MNLAFSLRHTLQNENVLNDADGSKIIMQRRQLRVLITIATSILAIQSRKRYYLCTFRGNTHLVKDWNTREQMEFFFEVFVVL